EAAETLWLQPTNDRGRRTLQMGDISILMLERSTTERRNVLLMTTRFLETAWLSGLGSPGSAQDFTFALTDADGRTVLGHPEASSSSSFTRAATATPWTLHVIDKAGVSTSGLSSQTKLVLAGIFMMAILTLAGGYLVHRSILRELRVARLQSDFVAA